MKKLKKLMLGALAILSLACGATACDASDIAGIAGIGGSSSDSSLEVSSSAESSETDISSETDEESSSEASDSSSVEEDSSAEESSSETSDNSSVEEDSSVEESSVSTHEHTYTSSVTTETTCTQDGVRTYTCACGDSYTETIPQTDIIGKERKRWRQLVRKQAGRHTNNALYAKATKTIMQGKKSPRSGIRSRKFVRGAEKHTRTIGRKG